MPILEKADEVIVIAVDMQPDDRHLTFQDFTIEGESVIPFFLDDQSFRAQIRGSGFEDNGIAIKTEFLASLLRGDEVFILNPGGEAPQKFTAAQLIAAWGNKN